MNEDIKKACDGLEYDDSGLLETDEILRSEVINYKIDYLTDCVKALANLTVNIRGKNPRLAVDKFNSTVLNHQKIISYKIAQSISQYKERKAKNE